MTVPAAKTGEATGFRPGARRRARIAAGIALAALAVGGNVLVYAGLDDSTQVVQFTSNIPAGDLIGSDDIRIVEIRADLAATDLVPAERVASVVGQYARTFIPARSLASPVLVRPTPLVTAGSAVVAIAPAGDRIPRGLTERSRVWLVVGADAATSPIEARIVAIDGDEARVVLSVEVAEADAQAAATADDIHVVLLDPGVDPAPTEADGVGGR